MLRTRLDLIRQLSAPLVVAVAVAGPAAPAFAGAQAATPPAAQQTPCAADENSRRFDFWIGEWEVRSASGALAGRNVIERVSGGCALLENWTNAQGGTGKSLNAYNRRQQQWQQFWVGQGGEVTEYRESSWDGVSLVFLARPGGTTIMRLTFTPVTPDHVRQHGELSTDDGRTWTTQYDLQYRRVRQ